MKWTNLSTVLLPQLIKLVYSTLSTDQTCLYCPVCLKIKPVLQDCLLNWLKLFTVPLSEHFKPDSSTVSCTDQTRLQYCFPKLIKLVYIPVCWRITSVLQDCLLNWWNMPTVLMPELFKPFSITVSWTDRSCLLKDQTCLSKCVYSVVAWTVQTCLQHCFLFWTNLSKVMFCELKKPLYIQFCELNRPGYSTVSSTDEAFMWYSFLNLINLTPVLFPELILYVSITVSWID